MKRFLILILFFLFAGCSDKKHWSETEAISHLTEGEAYSRARKLASQISASGVAKVTDTSNSMGGYISSYSYVIYEKAWDKVKEGMDIVTIKPSGGPQCHRVIAKKNDMVLTAGTNNKYTDQWVPRRYYLGTVCGSILHERNPIIETQ
jgi:hypothetical protein